MPSREMETKRNNKVRIAKFISAKETTSKVEIAAGLRLSMPTTLQNVKELVEAGVVEEAGQYASTGGRKAKALSVVRDACYSMGVDITRNHIALVLVNARKEIVAGERVRKTFVHEQSFYDFLKREVLEFPAKHGIPLEKLAGVGISVPGIVDREQMLVLFSRALGVDNVSFHGFGRELGLPCVLDNDANCAAYAELGKTGNAVYLSLSNTVGGAICFEDRLYKGENFKSAEFGHMVIEKNGRLCYCGKRGCVDAYCSALILQEAGGGSLEKFFERLKKAQTEQTAAGEDAHILDVWEEYVSNLALTIANLRMLFDCRVVLGGYVGGYLEELLPQLSQKVQANNSFDPDISYLGTGKYKLLASAYGAALEYIDIFLENV